MSAEAPTTGSAVDIAELRGWLPVDAVVRDGQPGLLWLDLHDVEFSEPFFAQTVERVKRERPHLGEVFTTFDALLQLEKLSPSLQPSGFIFHSSRCGSTLTANALRALSHTHVISEAYAVDKLIGRYFTDVQSDRRKELLYSVLVRGAINALGQPGPTTGYKYFVKFASISTLQVARLRKIWPDLLLSFVYRHPVEVMTSNLEDPPQWMDVEGNPQMAAALLDLPEETVKAMSREEFCARVLGRIYSTAQSVADKRLRLLSYQHLSLESLVALSEFFGIVPTDREIQAIASRLRIYAKDPGGARLFEVDTERKRKSASTLVWEMAEKWALAPYERLEQARIEQDFLER